MNMRQRRWLELVKDYDYDISYHPGKANIVVDALSRKTAVIIQLSVQRPLQAEIQLFELTVYAQSEAPNLSAMAVRSTLRVRIREGHTTDEKLQKCRLRDGSKGRKLYSEEDDIVGYRDRLWVPIGDSLRERDLRFTSSFWKSLHSAIRTKLLFITAFHHQTDVQSERVIQILEDLLRACMFDFQRSWEPKLPLVKFIYNNSCQSAIGMVLYEALNVRKFRSPIHWDEVGKRGEFGPDLIKQTAELVAKIQDRMKNTQIRQKTPLSDEES
ncbi:uncharacterized protein [Primulina huaijiensis]|uniref:uncharacterized protein n=1 Tax=Primulina huaijiensis TaxID=1492673 RepID=UPI003CC778B3